MLPALTICVFCFGILGRDGVWTLAGIAAFVVSMVVAGGVIYGMAKAAIYFIERVILA